ncbi:MAG: DUF308 domain-containing protein [Muribaculaceae bacterium]|nr:DUF308 domain-containing protein [Muribaculaceae bacterium]
MRQNGYNSRGITRLWWIPLITGILCIGFGVWCILSPVSSLPVLAYVFAGCFCGAGFLNVVYSIINARVNKGWGWSFALGVLELICGVWLFMLPEGVLVQTFIFIIGIWILVAAVNSICEACLFASYSPLWMVWMILLLVATVVFSIMFLSDPVAGGIAVWLWIGLSLILFGLYRIVFAVKVRHLNRYVGGL